MVFTVKNMHRSQIIQKTDFEKKPSFTYYVYIDLE